MSSYNVKIPYSKLKFFTLIFSISACVLTNFGYYNLFYLALIAHCTVLLFANHNHLKTKRRIAIIAIFLILIALSSSLFGDFNEVAKNGLRFFRWYLTIYAGYEFIKTFNQKNIDKIVKVILFIIFLGSIEGVIQVITNRITFESALVFYGDTLRQGIVSFFLQHIIWGNILLVGIILNDKKTDNWVVRWGLRILFLFNLYASKARSAWIGFAIYMLFILFRKVRNMKKLRISISKICQGVIIIVCAVVTIRQMDYLNVVDIMWKRMMRLVTAGDASYRLATIKVLLNDKIENFNLINLFWGSGYGSSVKVIESAGFELSTEFFVVDNQIITTIYDMGILAGVALIFLFFDSLYKYFKAKNQRDELINMIFIINFVMSLVYESFGFQVSSFLYFFVLGMKLYTLCDRSIENVSCVRYEGRGISLICP